MSDITFHWDPKKNAASKRKHGISFEEAQTVFADERAQLLNDPDHSYSEDRFVLLGLSVAFRVLVVVHKYRDQTDAIRIISARKATNSERASYDQRWRT
jgi:uncharacterized DUF497 family protein